MQSASQSFLHIHIDSYKSYLCLRARYPEEYNYGGYLSSRGHPSVERYRRAVSRKTFHRRATSRDARIAGRRSSRKSLPPLTMRAYRAVPHTLCRFHGSSATQRAAERPSQITGTFALQPELYIIAAITVEVSRTRPPYFCAKRVPES